ncbi:MAG: hypothetical protein Q9227_003600 [Pyrenula ochraceoflavens]
MSTLNEVNSESEFKTLISNASPSNPIILFFHTPWAVPCTQTRTILTTLASQYPPSTATSPLFLSINSDDLPDLNDSYNITVVPSIVILKDNKPLETLSGSDAGKIRDAVERHAGKNGNPAKAGLPPQLSVTPRSDINGAATTQPSSTATTTTGPAKDLSSYAPSPSDPATAPSMSSTQASKEELHTRLSQLVKAAPVMLFMKGTPSVPQCGFSRQLVSILRENGVKYGFFNILADEDVRQGLKEFADWPTFPQLWMGGELVGGLDIVSLSLLSKTLRGFFTIEPPAYEVKLISLCALQVKEEAASDPDFFKQCSVAKANGGGGGGPAAPDQQAQKTAVAA